MSDVVFRKFNSEVDNPCIYSTWRNAEWFSTDQTGNSGEFFRKSTNHIKNILKNATIKIACLKDDPDFILGYSVMTDHKLEFVYVKPDYRKKGIAKILTKGFKTWATPRTKSGRAIEEEYKRAMPNNRDEHQPSDP